MKTPKLPRNLLASNLQPWLYYGALMVVAAALLWFRLGTLGNGFSDREFVTLLSSSHLHALAVDPTNAPLRLPLLAILHFHANSLLAVRIVATVFGLATLSAFYWLVRAWHGQRAAVFGTLAFGASAWFLHAARLGTPDVLQFGLIILLACGVWMKQSGKPLPAILLSVLAAAFLYVPGMVWFIAAGAVWQSKTVIRACAKRAYIGIAGGAAVLLLLAPLVYSIAKRPDVAKELIGLTPSSWWPSVGSVARNLLDVPAQLLWHGPNWPERWLGRLPILDVFCLAMAFLGVYVYAKHVKLARAQLLAAIFIIGAVLVALQGFVTVSMVVPFAFVLASAGIGLLLDRWYAVFPRNPIAQTVGVVLVSIAVLTSCLYGLRHYFVAWPHAPATKQAMHITQASLSGIIIK